MIAVEVAPYRLVRIDAEHVDAVLAEVRPFLARAVAKTAGHLTLEEMIASLRQGWRDWMLWVCVTDTAIVGAMIVTMERCGSDLVATYELLASSEAEDAIAALFDPFERYLAQMWGVTMTRIVGRRGWERFLRRHGYEASHFITARRLIGAQKGLSEPVSGTTVSRDISAPRLTH
jgi:hypothetical protein